MTLFHLLDPRLQIARHRRLGRSDRCLLRASRFARSRLLARRGRRLRLASRGRGRRPYRRVLCASRTLIDMQKSLCMLTGQRIKRRRLVCRCRLSDRRELRRRRFDGLLPLCSSISRCSPQRLRVRRFHRGERLGMTLFHLLDPRLQIARHRRLGRSDRCLLRASRFARSRLLARRGRRLRLASRGRGRRPYRRVLCASRTLIDMQKSLCMLTGQRIKRRRLVCRCRLSDRRELRRRRFDGLLPLLVRRLEQKRLGVLRCVERGNALVGGLLGRCVERRGDLVLVLAQQRIAHRVRLVSRPAQRLRPL